MPAKQFIEVFQSEVIPHLFVHDFFARRLPELLDFFAGRERFGAVGREGCAAPLDDTSWEPPEVKALAWVNTVHPKFDQTIALKQVRRRYQVCLAGLRYTLPRLATDSAFQITVASLRSEDWKDWHILMAMLNAVANFRVSLRFPALSEAKYSEAMKDEIFLPEKPEGPVVPANYLTRERLRLDLLMALYSGLRSEGLSFQNSTPNIDDMFKYARNRWRYFELDVEHPDVFSIPSV